jgi:hypothetical protein
MRLVRLKHVSLASHREGWMEYSGEISSKGNLLEMELEAHRIRTPTADVLRVLLIADIPRREITSADMNSSMTSTGKTLSCHYTPNLFQFLPISSTCRLFRSLLDFQQLSSVCIGRGVVCRRSEID